MRSAGVVNKRLMNGVDECSSVTGGRLSEAQFDHLWIATGVDDTGVFKGLIILVISLHVIERGLRLIRRGYRQVAGLCERLASLFPIRFNARMELCLKRCDSCARTFNLDQMVELRDMPDAAGQIGFAIVSVKMTTLTSFATRRWCSLYRKSDRTRPAAFMRFCRSSIRAWS
jgi:hypothetical protein